ncbi:hypothetical protein [Desulfatibacillum aliphaticivorans]|uniref:hypothetical protein n=1 Tax=Desulfatibacillum aliphaticivorans TaxID=218208 RepID=UPI00040348D1|nr:hypothetical protein [Desulfatibacillum aliphaticivorans]
MLQTPERLLKQKIKKSGKAVYGESGAYSWGPTLDANSKYGSHPVKNALWPILPDNVIGNNRGAKPVLPGKGRNKQIQCHVQQKHGSPSP